MQTYSNKAITSWGEIDFELYFATEVLKLESLHYGYWEKRGEFSLSSLKLAQKRYTDTLAEMIPQEVKTILDVGAGIGDVAKVLTQRGCRVTAISPDKNHAKFYAGTAIDFVQTTFEGYESLQKVDLVLMSESQNYFETRVGFEKVREVVNENGYLLVSGKFRRSHTNEFKRVTNVESEYIETAKEYGLKLIKRVDVTDRVLPTLEMARKMVKEYLEPTVRMGELYLRTSSPVKYKIIKLMLKWFFNKQKQELLPVYSLYEEHIKPELFKKYIVYSRLMFKLVQD